MLGDASKLARNVEKKNLFVSAVSLCPFIDLTLYEEMNWDCFRLKVH